VRNWFQKLVSNGSTCAAYTSVAEMSRTLTMYLTLFGVNLVLLLLIFLKQVDFQPRLGVVTHTLVGRCKLQSSCRPIA
jgi:hypothetical protein